MTFEEFKKGVTPDSPTEYTEKNPKKFRSVDEHFVNLLLFQTQLKVMHWGTESFSEHKAYGEIYESIDEGLDSLVESYQGYHGRIDFESTCELIGFRNVQTESWLNSILGCLKTLRDNFTESDLQNMADELIAGVSKLKYLLTLK